MPSPVVPSQFCQAVPSPTSDFCTRIQRFFGIADLLCDFFTWFLNGNGTISSAVIADISTQLLPPGTIIYSAASSMGEGWLLADGSDVSRTVYADLFSAVGTRYGAGDNSTTFGLPDIRGRSPMGAGLGDGLTNRSVSTAYYGEENHKQTIAELVAHTHTWSGPQSRTEENGSGANNVWRRSLDAETESTGGGEAFNVIHPVFVAFAFIKT